MRLPLISAGLVFVALAPQSATAASATVDMTPTVRRSQIDITYHGAASGALATSYVVSWSITGTITRAGATTVVSDRGEALKIDPAGLRGVAQYPAPPATAIDLIYRIRVISASGVPTVECVGRLTRAPGGTPKVEGGC